MIAAIHLVAAIAFLFANFPIPAAIAVLIVILASGVACARAENAPHAVLQFDDTGVVTIHHHGAALRVSVLPTSVDLGWAVWLHWRNLTAQSPEGRRRSGALMLMPDQCKRGEWRQLRIWLRHKSGAALSDDGAEV